MKKPGKPPEAADEVPEARGGMKVVRQKTLKKWVDEAKAKGWELVRKVDKDRAEYRHIQKENGEPCGAVQEADASPMRNGAVRCCGCQDPLIRWKADAQAQGWELVRKVDGGYVEYRHIQKDNGDPCGGVQKVRAAEMRKGSVRCSGCQDPLIRWKADAEAQGWELVRKVDSMRAEYRHPQKDNGDPCGASQEVSACNMRKGAVRCSGCQDPLIRWKADAQAQGWELVGREKAGYAEYRHIQKETGEPCGAVQVADVAQMRRGTVRCGGCRDPLIRWKADAQAQGWELVRKVDGAKAEYRHLQKRNGDLCGAIQEAQATHMRKGTVRCGNCRSPLLKMAAAKPRVKRLSPVGYLARWADEALEKGWELVRKVDSMRAEYRHSQKDNGDPCGAVQEVRASNMRKGAVRCAGCQDPLIGWKADAEAQGWELVQKVDGMRAEFRHLQKDNGEPCWAVQVVGASEMRKGSVRCAGCQDPLIGWKAEAVAHGWELVRKVDKARAEYRHIQKENGEPCGAIREAHAAHMRKGSVRCAGCQDPLIGWKAEAVAHGWELVRKVDKARAEYRHNQKENGEPCGAIREMLACQMREGVIRCGGCQDPLIEWRATAQTQGWELVRKVDSMRAEYRHLQKDNGEPCGAVQVAEAGHMRNGGVRCDGCQDPLIEWRITAQAKGWKMVRKIDGNRAEYQHLQKENGEPCGAIQNVLVANMRKGAVRCGLCGDPTVSALHQRVRSLLGSMATDGVEFLNEVRLGMMPALVEDAEDGVARADFVVRLGAMNVVLEIDGQQHFGYKSYWHETEIGFKRQVFRDIFVEMDAVDQGMVVLRFGSWEDIGTIEAVLREVLLGGHAVNRLANEIPLQGITVYPKFWAWRDEAREDYRRRSTAR